MSWRRLREPAPTQDPKDWPERGLDRQVAVALRYDAHDHAPRLVAKGRGEVAKAILTLAETHGVPITKDPDLASLLQQLHLQQEIPPELYRVIAELLVFLYQLNAEYRP